MAPAVGFPGVPAAGLVVDFQVGLSAVADSSGETAAPAADSSGDPVVPAAGLPAVLTAAAVAAVRTAAAEQEAR